MARIIAVAVATLLTILVLYLPSAHPPSRFIEQITSEHGMNQAFWGERGASRILERMFSMQAETGAVAPAVAAPLPPQPADVNAAVLNEVARLTDRLFGSDYVRGIDALLLLAMYRLASLIEWLPILFLFAGIAWFDGLMMRRVRSHEFVGHDPRLFGVLRISMILVMGITIVWFVVPVTVHPLALGSAPATAIILGALAIANFHRHE